MPYRNLLFYTIHCSFTLKEFNWGQPTWGIMLAPEATDCQVKGPVLAILWNACLSCWLPVCMQESPRTVQATPSALSHPHVDGKTRLLKTAWSLLKDVEKPSWY